MHTDEAHPMTILLVDDQPEMKTLVEYYLKDLEPQPEILCATDCATALEIVGERKGEGERGITVDCILMDLEIGEEWGTDCLKTLRNERRYGGAVVILTGLLDQKAVSEALRTGADDFLLKDNMAMLTKTIEGAMAKHSERLRAETKIVAKQEELQAVRESLEKMLDLLERYLSSTE
jgi:DNA-binding response OmpR family regulator